MDKKIAVILTIAILISVSSGFAAGYSLALKNQKNAQWGERPGNGQFQARRAGGNNFASARGTIISKDDSSITVKLNGGGSANVFYSGATRVVKSSEASIGDLGQGEEITVMGTKNSDGSITAASIQIGGIAGGPGGMGRENPESVPAANGGTVN